jgi:Tetratrico peptide repeat
MKPRRNRAQLERIVEQSRTAHARALAELNLAVFHDNNSREVEAIPHYRRAIRLGLPAPIRTEALAWLASSLYKAGAPRAGLRCLRASRRLIPRAALSGFLDALERRIIRRLDPTA